MTLSKSVFMRIVILCLGILILGESTPGLCGEMSLDIKGFYPDMDARGGVVHLVFMGEHGGVFYMRSSDHGASWEGPMGVPGGEDANNRTGRPAVAGDSLGRGHITWSNGVNAAFHVMFDGTFSGKETAISSNVVVEPDIAVDMSDGVHIIAMVNDGNWFIGHTRNTGGGWEGIRQVSDMFHDAKIGAPSIVGDTAGSCHAGWKQESGGTVPMYARYDIMSGEWTDRTSLGPSSGSGDVFVSVSPEGFPRVSWTEYKNEHGWYVYGNLLAWKDAGGWHSAQKYTPGDHLSEGFAPPAPRICTDSLDRTYVTWIAADRLHLAVFDGSSGSWPVPDLFITDGSRQFYHGSCADDIQAYWVYEDERGGLRLSWGTPEDPPGPLRGDINGDGRVNGGDLVLLSLAFGTSPGHDRWNPDADLDGNGIIDGGDLAILGGHFGRG